MILKTTLRSNTGNTYTLHIRAHLLTTMARCVILHIRLSTTRPKTILYFSFYFILFEEVK